MRLIVYPMNNHEFKGYILQRMRLNSWISYQLEFYKANTHHFNISRALVVNDSKLLGTHTSLKPNKLPTDFFHSAQWFKIRLTYNILWTSLYSDTR